MSETLLRNEAAFRLGCFLAVFATMAVWEWLAPRRRLSASKPVRWANNLAIGAVDILVVRFTVPVVAVAMAALAAERGWGVLNAVSLPDWVSFLVAIVVLDGVLYLQHVMFHAVPALWRLHRVHHADVDLDVTSGTRFHPLEIVISMGIKLAAIVLLGPAPVAVLVFEVLLNGTAMFNHSNVRLPFALDRVLRLFTVTPDMHRVHHSVLPGETNTNFGFNLPWWDRLLGTYRDQPREGHEGMTIGIGQFREPRDLWLHRLIVQPFLGRASDYSITRWSDDR